MGKLKYGFSASVIEENKNALIADGKSPEEAETIAKQYAETSRKKLETSRRSGGKQTRE